MSLGLAEIASTEGDDSPYVNYVVVPSFAGKNLTDRTCPHFDEWLANVSVKCQSPARSWIYDHGIRLECLESWDKYCTTGEELLRQLLVMQKKLLFDETIILIGHKLGCYILKQALITAWHHALKDEYRQVLDMVETIMLVGEPSLDSKKPDECIELIAECVSRRKGLPTKLATGITVCCLQQISDKFEEIMLLSTVFDVSSSSRTGPKRKFRIKRMENDGCIGCASVHVRFFSTSSEESLLEAGPGDASICPFHPKSAHFGHLLTLNSTPSLPQIEASDMSDTILSSTSEVTTLPTIDSSQQILPSDEADSAPRVEEIDEETFNEVATEQRSRSPLTCPTEGVQQNIVQAGATNGQPLDQSDVVTPATTETLGGEGIESPSAFRADKAGEFSSSQSSDEACVEDISEISEPTEHLQATSSLPPARPVSEKRYLNEVRPKERKKYFSSFIPARDDFFYGRSDILQELQDILLVPQEVPSARTSISESGRANLVCLRGLPGIGKSAIAKEFAYRFMHEFQHIIWLNASSEPHLGRYCHDSAVALGITNGRLRQDHQASRSALMEYLRASRAPWLLILDNFEDGVDISSYLPNDSMCSVIATARTQPLTLPPVVWSVINVPGFTSEEGARFLLKCLDAEITDEDAEAICRAAVRFHISPLVCRQLTNWSKRGSISFKDITALLELENMSLVRRFESPVHAITSTTMRWLNPPATSLLRRLCFYDSTRVRERLVRSARARKFIKLSRTEPGSEVAVPEAASVLCRWALLDIDDSQSERSFCLQRAVQDSVRAQLDDESWRDAFNEACESISYHWPSSRKFKNIMGGFWEEFDDLHSHVHHLAVCLAHDRLDDRGTPYDPGEEFMRLLVHHTWYNSRRGNQNEDRSLHDLAQFLIVTRTHRPKKSQRAIPRRWLQVMDEGGFTARLVDTTGLHDSPYIALSYQWGQPAYLNPATVKEGTRGIDLSACPLQICDAISFTRNMGYKYLWIDSICLDQTNPTEVCEELAHMAEYYSNSSMIFCALEKYPGQLGHFRLKWKPSQRLDFSSYSILRSCPGESSRYAPLAESLWMKVWTLQERSLVASASSENQSVDGEGLAQPVTSSTNTTATSTSTAITTTATTTTATSSGATTPTTTSTSTNTKISTPSATGTSETLTPSAACKYAQRASKASAGQQNGTSSPEMPQNNGIWKIWLDLQITIITTYASLIMAIVNQAYATLSNGAQGIARFSEDNPQLRFYLLSLLLVVSSVCLGNCLPRVIL